MQGGAEHHGSVEDFISSMVVTQTDIAEQDLSEVNPSKPFISRQKHTKWSQSTSKGIADTYIRKFSSGNPKKTCQQETS
jgi:hypothetical protein